MRRLHRISCLLMLTALAACGGGGGGGGTITTPAPGGGTEAPPPSPGAPAPAPAPAPTVLQSGVQLFAGDRGADQADGTGEAARIDNVSGAGLTLDAAGNLYVANNDTLRRVTPQGVVTTLAGVAGTPGIIDGSGRSARLQTRAIAAAPDGTVYLAEGGVLRKATPDGTVTTVVGSVSRTGRVDGPANAAFFSNLTAITRDAAGTLYVLDDGWIRKIAPDGTITSLAGPGTTASFPTDLGRAIAVDGAGNLYVASATAVYRYSPDGVLTPLATGLTSVAGLALHPDGSLRVIERDGTIRRLTLQGTVSTVLPPQPSSTYGSGLAIDPQGNMYVADYQAISRIAPDGSMSTVAGKRIDTAPAALRMPFSGVRALAADAAGNVYVLQDPEVVYAVNPSGPDTHPGQQRAIVKISAAGEVSTLAHVPFSSYESEFYTYMRQLAVDNAGNVYTADPYNGIVYRITPDGTVVSWLSRQAGDVQSPLGVAVDAQDNVYVAEDNNAGRILKVTPAGVRSVLASGLASPIALAVTGSGTVYFSEYGSTLRKISPNGQVETVTNMWVTGLAADAAGNVFAGQEYHGVLWRITPAGSSDVVVGAPDATSSPRLASIGVVGALAVLPNPPNTVGTRLVVPSGAALLLVTLPPP